MYVWIPMECHGHVPWCAWLFNVCKWRLPYVSLTSFPRTPPLPLTYVFHAIAEKIQDYAKIKVIRPGYTVTMCSLLPREGKLWSDACLCVTSIRTHYDQRHYGYKHRVIRRISLSKWISKSRWRVNIRDLIRFYIRITHKHCLPLILIRKVPTCNLSVVSKHQLAMFICFNIRIRGFSKR